jgi:hypothetical protein
MHIYAEADDSCLSPSRAATLDRGFSHSEAAIEGSKALLGSCLRPPHDDLRPGRQRTNQAAPLDRQFVITPCHEFAGRVLV